MKWFYYYHYVHNTPYNRKLWDVSTQYLIYWRNLLHEHSVQGTNKKFPSTPQPNGRRYYQFMGRVDRWILLFEAELFRRRQYPEYRGFINKILHCPRERITAALVFADWCDDNQMPVMARRLRQWATTEECIRETFAWMNKKRKA